jgi:hypothetical protein
MRSEPLFDRYRTVQSREAEWRTGALPPSEHHQQLLARPRRKGDQAEMVSKGEAAAPKGWPDKRQPNPLKRPGELAQAKPTNCREVVHIASAVAGLLA